MAPPFTRFFVEAETLLDLSSVSGRGQQLIQRGVLAEVEPGEEAGVRWRYVLTPTRQQARLHQRKYKRPLSDYYLLTVKPAKVIRDIHDVAQPATPSRRREHKVRGHFRYYTPERPLFGRYSGMVWVPEHSRGDDNLGHIHKGYLVEGDEEP